MPMHAESIGVDLQVGLFVLQAAAQRLDKNIVQSAPAASSIWSWRWTGDAAGIQRGPPQFGLHGAEWRLR